MKILMMYLSALTLLSSTLYLLDGNSHDHTRPAEVERNPVKENSRSKSDPLGGKQISKGPTASQPTTVFTRQDCYFFDVKDTFSVYVGPKGGIVFDLDDNFEHRNTLSQDATADLSPYESIQKFAILDEDFREEGGELTATGKVRRHFTIHKYRDIIESFYTERF